MNANRHELARPGNGLYPIVRRARRPLLPPEPPVEAKAGADGQKSAMTKTEASSNKAEQHKTNASQEGK